MAEQSTLNTDLEQTMYRAALREQKLRQRARISILVPLVAGAGWLFYSAAEVTKWRTHSEEIQRREKTVVKREAEAQRRVAEAQAQRDQAEARAKALLEQDKGAKARADDIQQRLIKVREEIGALGVLLNELSSARSKASKLMASEAVESQIADIRTSLGRSLNRIEQQIDIVLPASEKKSRVLVFTTDEQQRELAGELKTQLESSGFSVAGITRGAGRKVETTEVRYFRDPEDKAEANRIVALVEKRLGPGSCKLSYASESENTGGRKFQVWLGKAPPPAPR